MTTFDEFPDATVARYGTAGSDPMLEEHFFKISQDTLFDLGVNILSEPGVPILKFRTVPSQTLVFPMEYGDSQTHEIESLLTITVIPPIADTTVMDGASFVTTFAGIGNVITPNGIFEDCIMLVDSIAGESAANGYRFYKNSFSNQIADFSIGTDPNTGQEVQGFFYRDTTPLFTSTTDEEKDNGLPLSFEGKINNSLQINSQNNFNAHCQLINLEGKLLQTWEKTFTAGDNALEMNNFQSSTGIYVILIYNKDTGAFKSFKFVD